MGLNNVPGAVQATIVIVTFNSREVVTRCLDAVQATIGAADEVLVVDNASNDGTPDLIEAAYAWVRLERSPTNLGFGAACNLAAALARGTYLVFLNPDTEPRAGWLAALVAPLRAQPLTTLVTAKLLLAERQAAIDTFGNDVHISGITTCHGWGSPAEAYDTTQEVSAVSGACFGIARSLFHRLRGFDARLFLYFEDTDLSLRARLAGCRCLAVPDAVVLHDHRPGFSPAKLRYLERNRWWTLLKVYQWRSLVALAPVLALAEILAWGMALRGGRPHLAAKLLACVDVLGWMPRLPEERAVVQHTRAVSDADLLRMHPTRLPFAQVSAGALGRPGEQLAFVLFGGARSLISLLAG